MNVPMPMQPDPEPEADSSSHRCFEIIDAIPESVFAGALKYKALEEYFRSSATLPILSIVTLIETAKANYDTRFSTHLQELAESNERFRSAVEVAMVCLKYSNLDFVINRTKLFDVLTDALRCEPVAGNPCAMTLTVLLPPTESSPSAVKGDAPLQPPPLSAKGGKGRTKASAAVPIPEKHVNLEFPKTVTKTIRVSEDNAALYIAVCTIQNPVTSLVPLVMQQPDYGGAIGKTLDDFFVDIETAFTPRMFAEAGRKLKQQTLEVVKWVMRHQAPPPPEE